MDCQKRAKLQTSATDLDNTYRKFYLRKERFGPDAVGLALLVVSYVLNDLGDSLRSPALGPRDGDRVAAEGADGPDGGH